MKGQQYECAERGDAGSDVGGVGYARYRRTESECKQIITGCGGMFEPRQVMSDNMFVAGWHLVMLDRNCYIPNKHHRGFVPAWTDYFFTLPKPMMRCSGSATGAKRFSLKNR